MVQYYKITESLIYRIERVKENKNSYLSNWVFKVTECRVSPSGEYKEKENPLIKTFKNMSDVDRFLIHKTNLMKGS